MRRKYVFLAFVIGFSIFLVSCTGLTTGTDDSSKVSVYLTDYPISSLEEFFVDVNAITINYETLDGTDSKTTLVEKKLDLLTLAATETELFNFDISSDATIESIKVNIGNPATATINGKYYTVKISGSENLDSKDINIAGVSIKVGPDGKDLIIDFNVAESIIYTGINNYKMVPVLKLNYRDRNQKRNYFYGEISSNSNLKWFLRLTENETAVATTMTNMFGDFRFGGVEEGNYVLNIYNPININFKDSEIGTISLPDTPTATKMINVPDDNGINIAIE